MNGSRFTHQFQAEPRRCSRRVATTIERIDLGGASNLMRVLICLTAPQHPSKVLLAEIDGGRGSLIVDSVRSSRTFAKFSVGWFSIRLVQWSRLTLHNSLWKGDLRNSARFLLPSSIRAVTYKIFGSGAVIFPQGHLIDAI